METTGVVERVERISCVRANPAADAVLLTSGLVTIREVRAWCDAQQAALVSALKVIDSFPENAVAEAAKQSLGQAAKSTERSDTLDKTPMLADALDDGAITAERADTLADVAKAGTVGYERCKLHHVIWWRNGGRTDLDNLLPVCSVHHSKIHNDHWIIELGPNRELTLRLPDGNIHTTGPPGRRQSAA